MPKGSEELTAARKEEIITACAELYKTMSFKDITIREIGNATTFTGAWKDDRSRICGCDGSFIEREGKPAEDHVYEPL